MYDVRIHLSDAVVHTNDYSFIVLPKRWALKVVFVSYAREVLHVLRLWFIPTSLFKSDTYNTASVTVKKLHNF